IYLTNSTLDSSLIYPWSSANQEFCEMQVDSPNAAAPFLTGLFRPSQSDCYEGKYQCYNGVFQIFPEADCSGTAEQFQLSSSFAAHSAAAVPSFQLRQTTITQNATIKYLFTVPYPGSKYTPLNIQAPEIIGTVCHSVSILLSFACFLYYANRSRYSGIKFDLFLSACHGFWIISECITFYIMYLTTDDMIVVYSAQELDGVFFSFASFLTFCVNLKTVLDLVFFPAPVVEAMIFFGATLIHILFAGYEYLVYLVFMGKGAGFLYSWNKALSGSWTFTMLAFDSLCTLIVTVHIVRSRQEYRGKSIIVSIVRALQDRKICAVLFIQAIIFLAYWIIYYLQKWTIYLGSFRADQSSSEWRLLLLTLHAVCSSYAYSYFGTFLQIIKMERTKKLFGK
ncbi:hypothetical protein HDU91_003396, partial [Kappamyces sp. JEL0680]